MHISQGHTFEKAVHRLGAQQGRTGLAFVCLSRAKTLVDLIVEPMAFDKTGNLRNSATIQARLLEEVRQVDLAESTRLRYTSKGVFHDVEGNQ